MTAIPTAVQGAFWMLISGTCYVASASLMRQLGDAYSPYELTFIRAIVAVVVLAPIFLRHTRARLWPERPVAVLMTGILSYLGILFWLVAASSMPLGDFFALQFITPLFSIAFAILFLRERADMASWAATLVGFAGVLIVLRPGMIEISLGAVAALSSSFFYASVNTVIKSLSRTLSATTIVFYANVWLVPISLPMAVIEWKTPLLTDLPLILGVGFLSTLGYVLVARGISLAPARVVQPVNFMRMPIGAVFGWVLFSEFPDLWTWIGAVVIFCATTYAVGRGSKKPAA
ncbi:MAG: DMT family transporter [Proteobacteria bacterium]|nr:DMT family transporter [Pseudomonadota bacterium]